MDHIKKSLVFWVFITLPFTFIPQSLRGESVSELNYIPSVDKKRDPTALIERGKDLIKTGKIQEGSMILMDLKGRKDLEGEHFYLIGKLFFDLGDFEGAHEHLADGYKLNKGTKIGSQILSLLSLVRKKLGKSYLQPARKALSHHPASEEALIVLVSYWLEKTDPFPQELQDLARQPPLQNLKIGTSLGMDLLKGVEGYYNRNYQVVIQAFSPHQDFLRSEAPQAITLLAQAYNQTGQFEKEKLLLKKGAGELTDSPHFLAQQGENARELGQIKQALSFYKKAISMGKNSESKEILGRWIFAYADLLQEMGESEKSGKAHLKNFQDYHHHPSGVLAYDYLFNTLNEGDPNGKSNQLIIKKLEKLLTALGRGEAQDFSKENYQSELNSFKSGVTAQSFEHHLEALDFKKALNSLDKLQKTDPNPQWGIKKGAILEKIGEYTKAASEYNKLFKKGSISSYELENHKQRLSDQKKNHSEIEVWRTLADQLDWKGNSKEAEKYRDKADKLEAKVYKPKKKKKSKKNK